MKELPDVSLDFARLVVAARKRLIGSHVSEIKYSKTKVSDQISDNRPVLSEILEHGANIYALWTRKTSKESWRLMYVGQRKSDAIYSRIIQHLFTKSKKTGSKLEQVKSATARGEQIGLTTVHVLPDELRTSVEERLIGIFKDEGLCEWNIHK